MINNVVTFLHKTRTILLGLSFLALMYNSKVSKNHLFAPKNHTGKVVVFFQPSVVSAGLSFLAPYGPSLVP